MMSMPFAVGTGERESPGTIQSGIMYIVHQMAAATVLNPVKEGRFILPGNDRRPADIFFPNPRPDGLGVYVVYFSTTTSPTHLN